MLFEGIALCLCAPVMSYELGKSLFDTGVLTIALATCAMLWNMLYNAMFERVENKFGFNRTVPVRIGHAVGFEGGLVLVVVLLAAWWLSISYWDAFLLEMGLIAFFPSLNSAFGPKRACVNALVRPICKGDAFEWLKKVGPQRLPKGAIPVRRKLLTKQV